jgi:CRP-like cAMP-binding protein
MSANAKIALLRAVPGLADYPDRDLAHLANNVEEARVEPGTVLTREGSVGRDSFFILEGDASVKLRGEHVATLGPGEFVGEMALLDHSPRSATVTANTAMRLLVLGAETFGALLERPSVARQIATEMADRLRAADDAAAESKHRR